MRAHKNTTNTPETPDELVYVYLSDEIVKRRIKPDEYDYADLFPTLEAHLERLGLEKSNETPDDQATDETPDTDDDDEQTYDDESNFDDEGPDDE